MSRNARTFALNKRRELSAQTSTGGPASLPQHASRPDADALDATSMCAIWSEVLKRPIRYAGNDLDALEDGLKHAAPAWLAYDMRLMMRRYSRTARWQSRRMSNGSRHCSAGRCARIGSSRRRCRPSGRISRRRDGDGSCSRRIVRGAGGGIARCQTAGAGVVHRMPAPRARMSATHASHAEISLVTVF
jgi:hypothetical protein